MEHSCFLDHLLSVVRSLGKSPSSQTQDVLELEKVQRRATKQISTRKTQEECQNLHTGKEVAEGEHDGVCRAPSSLEGMEGSQLLTAAPIAGAREHLAKL